MGLSPSPGSPPTALIACGGLVTTRTVTGQKYHYRLTGLLRNRLPQPVLPSDGYRLAPYLAVFDRILIFSLESYRWSWRIPEVALPFKAPSAKVFRLLDIKFSKNNRGIKNPLTTNPVS